MLTKGLLAIALAGLGFFAVSASGDVPAANGAQSAQQCPDMGLAALLRPMQH